MANQNESVKGSEPVAVANGTSEAEFVESGWSHYSQKEYFRAESDFKKALDINPNNVDTQYALAMTLMASARQQEAVQAFEKVMRMLQNAEGTDFVRAHMLSRLAQGHINRIQTGDWGIFKY